MKVLSMLFTLLVMLIPGCTPPQRTIPGFHPKLSISEPPALGKPVKLTLTFDSPVPKGLEATELSYHASIGLTPGHYEIVEGDLEQKGQIVPGQVNTLEVTIKSVKTGNGTISARVELLIPSGDIWEWEYDDLFIMIYIDHADVSEDQNLNITSTENLTTYTTSTTDTTTTSTTVPQSTNTTFANSGTTIAPSILMNGGNAPKRIVPGFHPKLSISEPPELGKPVKPAYPYSGLVITEVTAIFTQMGNLWVQTTPAVPATIFCNGYPMDDRGFWTNLEPGQHTISFQAISGYTTPPPIVVNVTAGQTTHVMGNYNTGQSYIVP